MFAPLIAAAADSPIAFERDVKPILQARCSGCHGAAKQRGGLRLDQGTAAFKGGDSGAAIKPGNPRGSLLFQRVSSSEANERMPPEGAPLKASEIALLEKWIAAGAVWPADSADDPLDHWSFKPVRRPTPPEVLEASIARNPIDRFLLARLEKERLPVSRDADRATLIRRLKFDLLGLPPTPEEVAAFVSDTDARAYEKLVDRYLASPHFGERWARHWLDVVRFAESDGFETNQPRPNAWPYRDYVIRSLNADKPYDQFMAEQLAGDVLGADDATGFLVGGAMDRVKSPDVVLTRQQRADELHDMVGTTGATFLGLTVGCARCHNHKFDPVSQTDYHAVKAVFAGVQHGERPLRTPDSEKNRKRAEELRARLAAIERDLEAYEPLASSRKTVWLDAADPERSSRGTVVAKLAAGAEVVDNRSGASRGCRDDAGDDVRLPSIAKRSRIWKAVAGRDLVSLKPAAAGRFRVWLSWPSGVPEACKDTLFLIESGDGKRREILRADQRKFADGSLAPVDGAPVWSGFADAGVHEFIDGEKLILRSSDAGTAGASVVLLQAESEAASAASIPHLRPSVQSRTNVERFEPVQARFIRFTIEATNSYEPCIDELEIFSSGPSPKNVALAKNGAKAKASGSYAGNPIHQLPHVNDGRYGNSWSWISNEFGRGWVEIELASMTLIDRVSWSRDREPAQFADRTATRYRIDVATTPGKWRTVASSEDRIPYEYRIAAVPAATTDPRAAAVRRSMLAEQKSIRGQLPSLVNGAMVYAGRFTEPEEIRRLQRGDPMQPREVVRPGALSQIGPTFTSPGDSTEPQRRLALARWITDPKNPLTARVLVNRLWHYHFGRGIVDTPSDFGRNGGRPSHPELLDWLASDLVAGGWRMKPIHRLIVLSHAYRQSSAANDAGLAADAQDRLLWRFPPRRLEAEPLRDAILFVSGKLDLRMGGPGFDLFEPNTNYVKVYDSKKRFGSDDFRRMVYQNKPRMQLDDAFGVFDCPDAGQIAPRRTSSITAIQALSLLNSPFLLQQAEFFAQRVEREAAASAEARVQRAFRLAFQRDPTNVEVNAATQLVRASGLPALCRALLNANEFIYVY